MKATLLLLTPFVFASHAVSHADDSAVPVSKPNVIVVIADVPGQVQSADVEATLLDKFGKALCSASYVSVRKE